jgi:hypothetical protein
VPISAVLVCLLACPNANAQFVPQSTQNSLFPGPPIVGGTPGMTLPGQSSTSSNNNSNSKFAYGSVQPDQHKTPTGMPCVSVNAMAHAQMINPKIFDHILVIENTCSQPVGLNLCYYQSKTCIRTTIAAYTRRQQGLGISPEGEFRFSYTEDFK